MANSIPKDDCNVLSRLHVLFHNVTLTLFPLKCGFYVSSPWFWAGFDYSRSNSRWFLKIGDIKWYWWNKLPLLFSPWNSATICEEALAVCDNQGAGGKELWPVALSLGWTPSWQPFSGTPQRHTLSQTCVLCPSQVWAAQATRCLASALSQVDHVS